MDKKIEFYIAFYEQLALQGFQAYKAYDNSHIADICVKGYNIAHFTKSDSIEPNPYAEGVEPGTIEKIREIMRETAAKFDIIIVENQQFTDKELSAIHAHLMKVRMTDNDLFFNETAELDVIIGKIEQTLPALAEFDNAADYDNEMSGEVEQ